jgi:hypothetical protein
LNFQRRKTQPSAKGDDDDDDDDDNEEEEEEEEEENESDPGEKQDVVNISKAKKTLPFFR